MPVCVVPVCVISVRVHVSIHVSVRVHLARVRLLNLPIVRHVHTSVEVRQKRGVVRRRREEGRARLLSNEVHERREVLVLRLELEMQPPHVRRVDRLEHRDQVVRLQVDQLDLLQPRQVHRVHRWGRLVPRAMRLRVVWPGRIRAPPLDAVGRWGAGRARAGAGVVEGEALEVGRGREHLAPQVEGHPDVVRVEGVLDRGEVAEEGGAHPGEVDALEDDVLQGGQLAGEDDDGRRADGGEEAFWGLPVLDVPELKGAEGRGGAAGAENAAGGEFAVEVGDLEMKLAPPVNVGEDNVEDGDELLAEEKVLAVSVGILGAGVNVDVDWEAGIASEIDVAAEHMRLCTEVDGCPEERSVEGDLAPVAADMGDGDLESERLVVAIV